MSFLIIYAVNYKVKIGFFAQIKENYVIIAIDGPAAAGKGTLARRLAKHLGFAYLDSGALYRAVALKVILSGGGQQNKDNIIKCSENIDPLHLGDSRLRDEAVGSLASKVASILKVRENLLSFQQNFAANPPNGEKGAVIDGRDIGTVVCPEADLKMFVTASAEERTKRRFLELQERQEPANYDNILRDIQERDKQDQERAVSPLVQAEDAILLDTTHLDAENVFKAALSLIKSAKLV